MTNKARDFAIKWHGDQMYGDKPYVYHLDQVAEAVLDLGYERWETQYDIAYLHDTFEDTECSYLDVFNEFGGNVADAVDCLTKYKQQPYGDYIGRVKSNSVSLIVKIADTKANLKQSILDEDTRRIVKYAKQLMLLEE